PVVRNLAELPEFLGGGMDRVDVAHDRHDVGLRLETRSRHARAQRSRVDLGDEERERAALPGQARQADLAAEQSRDLAAAGDADPRAAVLAAPAALRPAESPES